MTDADGFTGDPELWRRWQTSSRQDSDAAGEARAAEPDFMALAAYAEGAFDEAAAAGIELFLAQHPDALGDVVAARAPEPLPLPANHPTLAPALALVAAPAGAVVAFRAASPAKGVQGWRGVVAWGGIAAGIAASSVIGFALGSHAYISLMGATDTAADQELLDPPSGLFTGLADDEGS